MKIVLVCSAGMSTSMLVKRMEDAAKLEGLNVDILAYNDYPFSYYSMKFLIKKYGKTNKQIAEEIIEFCTVNESRGNGILEQVEGFKDTLNRTIEFYGYYSDYDWVVFCWLFGRMIDLPEGFPMCCIDLKQELDNKADRLRLPNTELSKEQMIETIKGTANYPKQTNEHNALSDARWNYELYKFLNKI